MNGTPVKFWRLMGIGMLISCSSNTSDSGAVLMLHARNEAAPGRGETRAQIEETGAEVGGCKAHSQVHLGMDTLGRDANLVIRVLVPVHVLAPPIRAQERTRQTQCTCASEPPREPAAGAARRTTHTRAAFGSSGCTVSSSMTLIRK